MSRTENIKEKLRIIRRDARGDKCVEAISSVIYELIDLIDDQQAEIETLRTRLAFAGWKSTEGEQQCLQPNAICIHYHRINKTPFSAR